MGRRENFDAFMQQYANVGFVPGNIGRVIQNLDRADRDGCLRQFLLNQKPYQCAFAYVGPGGARGKDQVAIVLAMNLYGANHPGFARRINQVMKELACGSVKQMQSVLVLMRAQMELQQLEISLINFADAELLTMIDRSTRKNKTRMVMLSGLLLAGGSMGGPILTMVEMYPLILVSLAAFFYGFVKLVFWLAVKPFTGEEIAAAARPVGECEL